MFAQPEASSQRPVAPRHDPLMSSVIMLCDNGSSVILFCDRREPKLIINRLVALETASDVQRAHVTGDYRPAVKCKCIINKSIMAGTKLYKRNNHI